MSANQNLLHKIEKRQKRRMLWFSAAAQLLLLLAGSVGAQLRGDSTRLQGDVLANDAVAVWNDQDDETERVLVQHVEFEHSLDVAVNSTRRLSASPFMFEPLRCNRVRCSAGSTTWKLAKFNLTRKVTIPCGACVVMDYDASDVLELPRGLNIEGSLRFPDGYSITIKTPFVHVQGVLEMISLRKVTGKPVIKILLTGTSDLVTSFIPADNNKFKCSPEGASKPSPCSVGRKPFVIAGGMVTIRGVPNLCPTWINLQDVLTADPPSPTNFTKLPTPDPNHPNPMCRSIEPYMQHDFSTMDPQGWTGGDGGLFDVSGGSLRVYDRKDEKEHAPTLDIRQIRDCLVPEQDYLFRARIKLTKPGQATGSPTTCATSNSNCLWLQSIVQTPDRNIGSREGAEDQNLAWRYGVWQDFYATVTYTKEELDSNAIYQILRLRGPDPEVEIEVDEFVFSLPPPAAVPDPADVCGGNIILNGNAELDAIHPYPFTKNSGALTVEESGGNNYFHHYARMSDLDSIYFVLNAPGCLVAGGSYKVSALIRVDSSLAIPTRIKLRSTFANGSNVQMVIAECSTTSSWNTCEASFSLLHELTGDGFREMRLQFETIGAPNRDMDIDDIELSLMNGPVTSLILPDGTGISNCWNKGAEILITSHTLNFNDGQVRRIISTPTRFDNGFVKLELDSAIVPPTTLMQSQEFAVEVALLSRNILFEGDTDDLDTLFGAHFMVMHTPASTARQFIEGIEFRNFGQQGVLGKYPIHFHMCQDVKGSYVGKNMIRESNQRCIVIHGTHNLTVIDNIAYDTHGHCYMTEDGGEIDNVFRRNLGALTQQATRLTRPVESDNFPSTFWCSNPRNTWVGNVAAGSRHNGFWFELQEDVRAPTADMPLSQGMIPRQVNLQLFRDNVAHSNDSAGLRTYPFGMMPRAEAVFYNTRSFKNKNGGVFFHNSRNLAVSGGVLADNKIQFDFDRGAENIRFQDTSVIGVTDLYKEVVRTQPGAPAHDVVVGLELHGFTLDMSRDGGTIRNITFSGFADTRASHIALIEIDPDVSHGHFDYWSTFEGITITDDVTPAQFDFTGALANGIDGIYLTDLDSSMRPRGSTANGVSTIISNNPAMTQFIDLRKCNEFADRGYMYCEDTCLRTIVLLVPPSVSEDFVLRINEASNPTNFLEVNGKFEYETLNSDGTGGLNQLANTSLRKRRFFAVALPPARYNLSFLYRGALGWPTSVEFTMEEAQCDTPLEKDWIILSTPSPSETQCRELIRNGNFEGPISDWLHDISGRQVASGQGISGSKALSDIDRLAPANGLIGQHVDTRCLKRGRQYQVRAWVKLMLNGSPVACDSVINCPTARLRSRTPVDQAGLDFSEYNLDVVSFFTRPYLDTGWNLLQGVFTVNARIEAGESVLFYVQRGRTGINMLLDDVSISPIPKQCNQLVFNGDFSDGRSSFWSTDIASVGMAMVGNALEMTNRTSLSHSPGQDIRTGCMKAGERYIASARVRLENRDGTLYTCNVTSITGNVVCPRMRLRSFVDIGLSSFVNTAHDGGIAITDHGTFNGWYIMSGVFMANNYDAVADKSTLTFDQVSSGKDFIIDDVSIVPLAKNCNELFLNGDADYGETPSFWTHWLANGGEKIDLVSVSADNHAFEVHERAQSSDGIHQFIDPRCLIAGRSWKLVARMKLISRTTGQGVTCDPLDKRLLFACPPVRIAGWSSSGAKEVEQPFYMSNRPNWSATTFNTYEVVFKVNAALANVEGVSIGIRGYNLDWELIVDGMSLRPL